MFTGLDSRVALLGDQLKGEFRGAPRKEAVREQGLTVLSALDSAVSEQPVGDTKLPCLRSGYDRDCHFAADCDHTPASCQWLCFLADS